jgi:hypothetical protein
MLSLSKHEVEPNGFCHAPDRRPARPAAASARPIVNTDDR